MRAKKLAKFLRAMDVLGQPTGATVAEMEERLDLSRKGVYDLLNFIRDDMRFHIHEDASILGGGKRFSLSREDVVRAGKLKVPNINLSLSEIAALYFLKSSTGLYQGTEIQEEIERAFVKLDHFMPDEFGAKLASIAGAFVGSRHFAKDYSAKEEILETLVSAIANRKICAVTYHTFSEDQIKTYRIAPLQIFEHQGGLYLFSLIVKYGDIRMQAVERIQQIEELHETFERPEDFDANALLETAFGLTYDDPIEVKIRFAPNQARYIKERRWAKIQTLSDQPDGSLILEMQTSGWYEVKRWLLSFGAEAELLSPQHLVDDLTRAIDAMHRLYSCDRQS
ncbi:MAG: WYL domain-containing protein [Desulfuromonadales bacterium]|nr:WYL domain-containing protein [Desulfuromonadales bacterium]